MIPYKPKNNQGHLFSLLKSGFVCSSVAMGVGASMGRVGEISVVDRVTMEKITKTNMEAVSSFLGGASNIITPILGEMIEFD